MNKTAGKEKAGVGSLLIGKFGVIIGLVVLCAVFGLLSEAFRTPGNLRNILIQAGTNSIIAAGMTFVILAAGIDLSVGSIVALSSVLGASIMKTTDNILLGMVVALAAGVVFGLFNGIVIAYLDFPPFIVTLSTMWLYRGSAYVFTNGQAIVNLPDANMALALGRFVGIPYIVWLIIIVYTVCLVILTRMTFGRKVYAVGDNAESARLSGINVQAVKTMVYAISGFLAALGGIILMSRLNSGQPIAGQSFEMTAIAAAVIGGTSLTKGGVGSIGGTLIGALFISALMNGLIILNVSAFWQQVVMGIVVLIAIGIDRYRKSLGN
ncbi:MAG: ABC transporter permease [Planctomycetota bacterium]|jgi:ribose transport system permease protein|nr:ABC transporter permease [Planctomycetota bacterium]